MMTIYGLTDPRDELIHYVGKTNKADRRLIEHRNEHGRVNEKKTQWLNELQAEGLQPSMSILELCEDDQADARELHWITAGRERGWPLVNKAHGYETTERKLDALIERAVKLGVMPVYTPGQYNLAQKKRALPFIVEQAEQAAERSYQAMEAAHKHAADLEEYLNQVTEFVHGPDYS